VKTWPDSLKHLSKPKPRVDGRDKVTGKAQYAYDVLPQDWLYAMILRSPVAAGTVTSIDLEAARRIRGVRAVVLSRELPLQVRFYGQELAAVAADTKQACEDALQAMRLRVREDKFVVRELEAVHPYAARVFSEYDNISKAQEQRQGDPEKAMTESATTVEGIYATAVNLHQPMETHGNTISFNGEELLAWSSTQGVFGVRDGLAGAMGIPLSKARVITRFMGGGFGSKFPAGAEGRLAAELSRATGGRPVKLMLSRFEESLAVGNRPSCFARVKLGTDPDGRIHAYEMTGFGCAGYAGGGSSEGGSGGASFPANHLYPADNARVDQRSVTINAGSGRAFRAPGHPPGVFIQESLMDQMALALDMDPLEFRLRNDDSAIRREEFRIGAERIGWKEKYRKPGTSEGPVKSGLGCAGSFWGVPGGDSNAEVQVNPDGSVVVRCGTQDIGTGTSTLVPLVAAEVLRIDPNLIQGEIGDTRFPYSGGSGGSRTAPSVAPAVFDACANALAKVAEKAGLEDVRGDKWIEACRRLRYPIVAQGEWKQGPLSSRGAYGAQFAEVEVDTETGFIELQRIVAIHDCGLVINPLTARSQVNGGIIMGIGGALYEDRVMDPLTGVVLNPNYETYKLPGMADIPDIDVVLLNFPDRGVIGMGEPVHIPTSAAIANAVANAIGVRVQTLPITPAKVLSALGQAGEDRYQRELAELHDALERVVEVAAMPQDNLSEFVV
jgi:xanthine dehydrogenase YagR molybdenum-binding subunit